MDTIINVLDAVVLPIGVGLIVIFGIFLLCAPLFFVMDKVVDPFFQWLSKSSVYRKTTDVLAVLLLLSILWMIGFAILAELGHWGG